MNGTSFLRQCAEKEAFNKLRQTLLCLPYFLSFQPTETESKIPARPLRKDDAAKRSSKKILSESLDLVTVARYIVVTGPVHSRERAEEEKNGMYTIGEFSNLAHVSARSLRYYDAMGLLRPAHMGENGYRYYTGGQLPALAKIETLKSYGFTLAEVKELLLLPETELAHRIHVRRISAYAQLNEMRRVIRRMEAAIVQMEGTSMANDTYHVILMQAPAQKVFSVRRTIQIGEMHDLFAELRAQMKRAGVRRTGPTQARYHGEEFSYEHMDVEAQAAVDADGPNVSVIPAGTFAAVTHTGPYENIKYAYDALCGWVAHHPEYKVCGPAIERYIKDEAMVHDSEELETGVLFPVCRAEE